MSRHVLHEFAASNQLCLSNYSCKDQTLSRNSNPRYSFLFSCKPNRKANPFYTNITESAQTQYQHTWDYKNVLFLL